MHPPPGYGTTVALTTPSFLLIQRSIFSQICFDFQDLMEHTWTRSIRNQLFRNTFNHGTDKYIKKAQSEKQMQQHCLWSSFDSVLTRKLY